MFVIIIKAREAAEKLSKQVEEACAILVDYNNRLTEELEDRKHVSKMLGDFTRAQRERVAMTERKVEVSVLIKSLYDLKK